MPRRRARLLAGSLALAAAALAVACEGDLEVGDDSRATAISDSGWVALSRTVGDADECYARDPDGGLHLFASGRRTSSRSGCGAEAINDDGLVVGWERERSAVPVSTPTGSLPVTTVPSTTRPPGRPESIVRPVAWSPGGGRVALARPAYGEGTATDVNDRGDIVGHQESNEPILVRIATRWNADGTVTALGGPVGQSFARGLNDQGDVVGYTNLDGAVRWRPGTNVQEVLGRGPGTTSAIAEDINDAGAIVGQVIRDGRTLPALWAPGASEPLVLPTPAGAGVARAIAEDGGVVGEVVVDGRARAAYWTPGDHRFVDLGTLGGESASASGINGTSEISGWIADAGGITRAVLFDTQP